MERSADRLRLFYACLYFVCDPCICPDPAFDPQDLFFQGMPGKHPAHPRHGKEILFQACRCHSFAFFPELCTAAAAAGSRIKKQ